MRYARLGRSGVQVSRIALGTGFFGTRLDKEESARILDRALDLGINVVDTAESYLLPEPYASETVLGEILQGRRDGVFLSSKVGPNRFWDSQPANRALSRRVIVQAVEGCLRRLQTDHLDLLYLHEPDPGTPLEESLSAVDDLIRAGKVRYAGLSNHAGGLVVESLWIADRRNIRPIVATQDLYNLFERVHEYDLFPACLSHDLGVFAYAPLAGGLLTGKYTPEMVRGESEVPAGSRVTYYGRASDDSAPARSTPRLTGPTIAAVSRVSDWAEERGHSITDVALAWVLGEPAVTSAVLGVTTVEQLESNVLALDLELSRDDRTQIAELVTPDVANLVRPMMSPPATTES